MTAFFLALLLSLALPPAGTSEDRLPPEIEERFERLFRNLDKLEKDGVDVKELRAKARKLKEEMLEDRRPRRNLSAKEWKERRWWNPW